MDDKIKKIAKGLGAFGLGFIAGKNASKITSTSKREFDVDGLIEVYDHDLKPEEIDYIKSSFNDPDVVAAFAALSENPDKQTKELWQKSDAKIEKIRAINPELALQLSTTLTSIKHDRRKSLFCHFIVNNSEEKVIALLEEINRNYKDVSQMGERWHAICEGFEFFDSTPAEHTADKIYELLVRKQVNANITVNFLLGKTDKEDISNSFLGWLNKNHKNEHHQFFLKAYERAQVNEAETLKILNAAMSLETHDERFQFLKLQGLI